MEVNVVALLSVCREYIRNQAFGNIINFSSIYGVASPRPDMYHNSEKFIGYSVSKAAVIQLTRHLAIHSAPNFRVNCVMPGGIYVDQPAKFVRSYSRNAPIGRMMNLDEITGIVEFLISEKSSYCTAGIYPVDGGWTAW
jgi:gluconate 5-dehydrogenase